MISFTSTRRRIHSLPYLCHSPLPITFYLIISVLQLSITYNIILEIGAIRKQQTKVDFHEIEGVLIPSSDEFFERIDWLQDRDFLLEFIVLSLLFIY